MFKLMHCMQVKEPDCSVLWTAVLSPPDLPVEAFEGTRVLDALDGGAFAPEFIYRKIQVDVFRGGGGVGH